MAVRSIGRSVLLVAGLFALTACSGGAGSGTVAASSSSASAAGGSSSAELVVPSTSAIRSAGPVTMTVSSTFSVAPDCTAAALTVAINTGRGADAQLTVGSDFQCAQNWAVVGGTDTVNKAQYTFLLQWADGAWQPVDRTEACAGQDIPAELTALACHSN